MLGSLLGIVAIRPVFASLATFVCFVSSADVVTVTGVPGLGDWNAGLKRCAIFDCGVAALNEGPSEGEVAFQRSAPCHSGDLILLASRGVSGVVGGASFRLELIFAV